MTTRDEKVALIRHWEQTVEDVGMMVRVLLEAEHVRTITRLTDEGLDALYESAGEIAGLRMTDFDFEE